MRTRQGETIFLGEWIRPASTDFPPAGGVWGGMRAGFGLGVFGKFAANHNSLSTDDHACSVESGNRKDFSLRELCSIKICLTSSLLKFNFSTIRFIKSMTPGAKNADSFGSNGGNSFRISGT